jgi:hypothetical protein
MYITDRGLCDIGLELVVCETDLNGVCLCWR